MLRIVFMGSPEFAVPSLRSLHGSEHEVVAVVTNPDKPAGRGRKVRPTAVKEFAGRNGLQPVLQPDDLKDPKFLNDLKDLGADLFVVVAFRMLPEAVLNLPDKNNKPIRCINLHASYLPDYRGAAPINWVLINGEEETGITTFLLDKHMDTGKIIDRQKVGIYDDDTAGSLHDRLMERGAKLLIRTIGSIDAGNLKLFDQQDLVREIPVLNKAPKLSRDDGRIDWKKPAGAIRNLVRGLSPAPGAWTEGRAPDGSKILLKIFNCAVETPGNNEDPGTLITDYRTYLKFAAEDGLVRVTELQPSGRKPMTVREFLQGARNLKEYKF